MPSTLTHYIFNKDLIKDDKYKDVFLLGGQGADTLFFYGYNISKRENKKEIRNLGYTIHSIDPDKLYMEMLRYSFSKQGEEKEILLNFTRGFMYHYALDKNVHPYVFYNTGFPYTNPMYNRNHSNFESILDTLLKEQYNEKKSTRSALKANNKYVKICSNMLCEVLSKYFDITYLNKNTYYKAYKDFRFVRLIADSKFGVKKALFNKFMKNSSINTISQPKKVKDKNKHDYLNVNKKEWFMPTSGNKRYDSLNELFIRAKEDCRIIDTIIYNFKDNIVTQRKLSKFTNNTNHDGRELDKYMTYFKVIWRENND